MTIFLRTSKEVAKDYPFGLSEVGVVRQKTPLPWVGWGYSELKRGVQLANMTKMDRNGSKLLTIEPKKRAKKGEEIGG